MGYFSRSFVFYRQMSTESLKTSITNLIDPILNAEGAELVDVELEKHRNHKTLRLLIYKSDGVSIEDCRRVTKMLQPVLAVHQLLVDDWSLEVASPGLDRPLRTFGDFRRNCGQPVTVDYIDHGQNRHLVGIVTGVANGVVSLQSIPNNKTNSPKNHQEQIIDIQIADITKAKIELIW